MVQKAMRDAELYGGLIDGICTEDLCEAFTVCVRNPDCFEDARQNLEKLIVPAR